VGADGDLVAWLCCQQGYLERSDFAVAPIVPLSTSKAASLPVSSAMKLSRPFVVGSSWNTSSKRVVAVTAASIRGVGVVTTSPVDGGQGKSDSSIW
jgi:hypothetical protein